MCEVVVDWLLPERYDVDPEEPEKYDVELQVKYEFELVEYDGVVDNSLPWSCDPSADDE